MGASIKVIILTSSKNNEAHTFLSWIEVWQSYKTTTLSAKLRLGDRAVNNSLVCLPRVGSTLEHVNLNLDSITLMMGKIM